MSWYVPFAENIKKRACRYLLQRYLGQYLEEKLTLDQLTVDLYKGTGSVSDVSLDCQAINELCTSQGLPIEILEGHVASVSVSIPWSAPLSDDSFVDISGLVITIRPKARIDHGTSVLESMWSSMSSSMQLAKDCLEKEGISTTTMGQPLEGLEHFAQTIDSILTRIKVRLTNSIIKLEHCPNNGNNCLTLEINIKNMEYFDEAGSDPPNDENEQNKKYVYSSFTNRHIVFEGISLYTNESILEDDYIVNLTEKSSFASHSDSFGNDASLQSSNNIYYSCELNSFVKDSNSKETDEVSELDKNKSSGIDETFHEPILFGQLLGRQEIQIKMKQSESIVGPKVQLDISMGSLTCFITPRQLHTLIEIVTALSNPETDIVSDKAKRRMVSKPMTPAHFKLIEDDLQTRIKAPQGILSGLSHVHAWSTAQIDDDGDNDSDFQPFRGFGMSDSIMSNNSTMSMTSSISSSISQASSRPNNHNKPKGSLEGLNVDNENGNEISHYSFRLASVAVIILHEDILTTSSGFHGIGQTRLCSNSIKQLRSLAQEFFQAMGLYSAFGAKDFSKAISSFNDACQLNHIRLLAAPVIIEGHEKKSSSGSFLEMSATAAKLILHELRPMQKNTETVIPLLEFIQMNKAAHMALLTKPQLKIKIKVLQKSNSSSASARGRHKPPRSELSIFLEPCICEVDISIVDRISAFFVTPLWTTSKIFPVRKQSTTDVLTTPDIICEYKMTCEEIQVKLRFPVVDLRPKHDPLRPPWWDRNVHSEFAFITLKKASGRINSIANNGIRYELQCQEAIIDYVEAECNKRIPIAHAGSRDKLINSKLPSEDDSEWPRLLFDVYPSKQNNSLESSSDNELPAIDPMLASIGGTLRNNMQAKEPSPFSARRIIHKSDTSHMSGEGDELIIPGTRSEMKEFSDTAKSNSVMQIELSLQYVTIQLNSKHLYEKIYNHINTDLLLWEPSASFISSACTGSILQDIPIFSMCKSGIHYDSESSTHESDSDSNSGLHSVFYSMCDRKVINMNHQHDISFNLEIKKGILTMCAPVRDAANHVIPGQQGEFVIRTGELSMFSVSGFNGDAELGFVCVQAKDAEIYHSGLHSIPEVPEPLRLVDCSLPSHIQKTILPNPDNHHRELSDILSRDMVTVALRIHANHENKLKHVRTAIGVQEAMLMHRSAPPTHTWLTQLIDLFDVQDLPVQGYEPSNVITEIHLHVWDSAVEYRPLYLPLRARVTLGAFSMSSNIIAQSPGVNLRFMAEDCTLELADLNHLSNHNVKMALKDLNYVTVVELGLFELSLRLNEKTTNSSPKVDLRASNNALHIRTCADSGRALAHLIAYIAEEGDLQTTEQEVAPTPVCVQPSDQLLLENGNGLPNEQSKKLEKKVNELMAEAMLESLRVSSTETESDVVSKGVEVFFFPDETKHAELSAVNQSDMSTKVSTTFDRTSTTERKKKLSTGDDFCIVGDEAGVGVYPKNGHPEVRWLSKEPIHIVDNHFAVPTSKTDLLKAPREFPMALFRYTLCEVTLTWFMYGGNDFEQTSSKTEPAKRKVVTIDEGFGRDIGSVSSVRYSVAGSKHISLNREDVHRRSKIVKHNGGTNRKENVLIEVHVNKVRFTHETYPDQSSYASRQVLLIGELEVRDRLEVSHINKLLYQQSSEQRPRQSNANMIMIKATHMRPDPCQSAQECSLRVSLLPLRLNIDQDTLLFLIQFFGELSGSSIDINKTKTDSSSTTTSRHTTPTHQIPIMTVEDSTIIPDPEKLVSENLMLLLDEQVEVESNASDVKVNTLSGENVPIYFRNIVFSPDVPIRLDYNGKRVELSHGPLAGLLMGLGQLECSELTLRRITHKHGILGIDKLMNFLMQQWLQDIKKRQLPSLLGGIGPIHSIVQLFQGIRDLFWLPIEQYQKDGRIVRGLQRGANSFTACTALAALQITTRIIHLIQATAETAFDMVSPGPSVKRGSRSGKKRTRRGRAPIHPPQDIREGVANAYQLVIEGLGDTASNLVHIASVEHSQKGMSGAVGGVLRQLPPTVVAPLVIASQATQHVLGGVTSQLVPDARLDAKQKWRLDERQ